MASLVARWLLLLLGWLLTLALGSLLIRHGCPVSLVWLLFVLLVRELVKWGSAP